jgi:hypothetical protein
MKKILLSSLVLVCLLTNQKSFSQTACALNPDFSDPDPTKIVDGGSPGGGYEVGDAFLFENVLPSVNAVVTIEEIVGAVIWSLDNNSADPQRFQPFIGSNSSGSNGHVQFSIVFRRTSNNTVIPLSQLRLSAFDVDGDSAPTHSISEVVWAAGVNSVTFNSPTTLTDGGVAVDAFNWRKVIGQSTQYTGTSNIPAISNDPAHAFTAEYAPGNSFRIRLGYTSVFPHSAGMDYSVEFGCFVEAENVPLPLTLLNFNGAYANNKSVLNWTTQSEINVERFEVERSLDGNDFVKVGAVAAKGANGTNDYQLIEDLTNVPGAIFYYRLKSLDKDGKFTYSKVVAVKRDTKLFNQISITPNPIINGNGVIKITATSMGTADVKIVDFAGRIIMLQKVNLFEGVNVLPINVARQLSAGVYSIQLFKGGEVFNSKFVVGR